MSAPITNASLAFFDAVHGTQTGTLAIFSGRRSKGKLVSPETSFLSWPQDRSVIAAQVAKHVAAKREVYACAHFLTASERDKKYAAPVRALWADVDHDHLPDDAPRPSVVVQSSPNKWQAYWHLTEAIEPERAESLNRRLAILLGADPTGWDLTQLLRIPGTPNRKYPDAPIVAMIETNDVTHDPDTLDRILPPLPVTAAATRVRSETTTRNNTDAEPPIVLDDEGMAVWAGDRPKVKHDGTGQLDRSASLMKIARALFDAGATRPTIVQAIAERDATLGWRKYTDRRDADAQYHGVVDELERTGRTSRARLTVNGPSAEAPCSDRVAALETEVATLRQERNDARATVSTLIHIYLSPHLKPTEKTAVAAVYASVQHKRDRGEVEADGSVVLSSAEISNDWRPAPKEKGERVATHNPKDGSAPRMAREQVRPILTTAIERGIIPATSRKTFRPRANGSAFKDTDWVIDPKTSAFALLTNAATWKPTTDVPRKPRTVAVPCPHCNEVHPIRRHDYCNGCGALRNTTTIDPPTWAEPEEMGTSDNLSDIADAQSSPPPCGRPKRSDNLSEKQAQSQPSATAYQRTYSHFSRSAAPPDRYTDMAGAGS